MTTTSTTIVSPVPLCLSVNLQAVVFDCIVCCVNFLLALGDDEFALTQQTIRYSIDVNVVQASGYSLAD